LEGKIEERRSSITSNLITASEDVPTSFSFLPPEN